MLAEVRQRLPVDWLSSTAGNARQIRDAIMQMPQKGEEPYLVLIGYSKGAPELLDAIVSYPETRPRIAAAVRRRTDENR
jgi:hypothetical protein